MGMNPFRTKTLTVGMHLRTLAFRSPLLFIIGAVFLAAQAVVSPAADLEAIAKQLDKSLETWTELKAKCGGNYSYKVRWQNRVGFGHETAIIVRTNQVVERKYSTWKPANGNPTAKSEADSWSETGKELGSHKKGAPVKTLDELYQEAKDLLKKKFKPYMKPEAHFDKAGLLQGCYFVNTNYAEDPPRFGVIIESIELER